MAFAFPVDVFLALLSFLISLVNGRWSKWATWSKCSKTCGYGSQTRFRTCSNPPPKYGGKCKGPSSQRKSCLPKKCPGMMHQFIIILSLKKMVSKILLFQQLFYRKLLSMHQRIKSLPQLFKTWSLVIGLITEVRFFSPEHHWFHFTRAKPAMYTAVQEWVRIVSKGKISTMQSEKQHFF